MYICENDSIDRCKHRRQEHRRLVIFESKNAAWDDRGRREARLMPATTTVRLYLKRPSHADTASICNLQQRQSASSVSAKCHPRNNRSVPHAKKTVANDLSTFSCGVVDVETANGSKYVWRGPQQATSKGNQLNINREGCSVHY